MLCGLIALVREEWPLLQFIISCLVKPFVKGLFMHNKPKLSSEYLIQNESAFMMLDTSRKMSRGTVRFSYSHKTMEIGLVSVKMCYNECLSNIRWIVWYG